MNAAAPAVPAGEPGTPRVRGAVIASEQTPWAIAGPTYDAPTTLYLFPDGTARRGDAIADWSDLASGTRVHLDVPEPAAP